MMNQDFAEMLAALSEAGAEFMVVGAHAVAVYANPRATGDLNIWVNSTPENAQRVWSALVAFGAEIVAAYEAAQSAGKYAYEDGRTHYAMTNASEYWAEGVQWWFFSNYGECFAGDVQVESPEEFGAYDPALFELIGRVFTTHRISMDVFHARRIRPLSCPPG